MKKYFKFAKEFIALSFITLIALYLSSVIFNLFLNITNNDYIISIMQFVLNAVFIITGLIIYYKFIKKDVNIKKLKPNKKIVKSRKMINFVIVAISAALIAVLGFYAYGSIKFSGFIWRKFYAEDITGIFIVGIFECFLEVFIEEILYRFTLNEVFIKYMNVKWSVLLAAICYVAVNDFDRTIPVLGCLNLGLLSILMSLIYIRYKNIWYSIIPRSLFEYIMAYGFSINRFGRDEIGIVFMDRVNNTIINGGQYGIYGSVIIIPILSIFIAIFMYRWRMKV